MNITVLAGGISTERDVSLVSGMGVYKALKEKGHNVVLMDVFLGYENVPKNIEDIFTLDRDFAAEIKSISEDEPEIEKVKALRKDKSDALFGPNVIEICKASDIVFMALHGESGENGKVQATFDLLGIKYTGTDYLSSALAMDKEITKLIFMQNGVSTPKGYVIHKGDEIKDIPEFPVIVKICNGGSSVGVFIVNNVEEYRKTIDKAFKYEDKVLVEQFIKGREFTDCVIDGEALPVVEIAPVDGFYDYKHKYQAGAAVETCPANIPESVTKAIQEEAIKAYNALGIKTYARMDFMMDDKTGEIYCLEANTLPGMTPTSLIPQEAKAIGKSYSDLCEWIINISLDKYK